MTDKPKDTNQVGYRNPPVEHQFTKGTSGNYNGRPRKARKITASQAALTSLEDMLLSESRRSVKIRENDQVSEMPAMQAVIRGLVLAGLKGDYKVQLALTKIIVPIEARRAEDMFNTMLGLSKMKDDWLRTCAEFDRLGIPRPDRFPHPDDIVLDFNAMEIHQNGPVTFTEKAEWDQQRNSRDNVASMLADSERECRESPKRRKQLASTMPKCGIV